VDLNRDKLESAFTKVIAKNRSLDPISLSEKIVDTLELIMDLSDTGYGVSPVRITDREEEPAPRSRAGLGPRPVDEERIQAPLPSPARSGMILTPEDPEFQKAQQQVEAERQRGRIPSPARLTKVGEPGAGENSNIQYWTVESLIQWCESRFPPQIAFTPNGMPDNVVVVAGRNIQAQINAYGPHAVRVTYAHESINQDGIDSGTPVGDGIGKVNIAPIASKLYSCGQQNIDAEHDLEDLLVQLKGLYRPRPPHMEPGYIGESAMDGWNANQSGMKDSETIRGAAGWNMVENPAAAIRNGIISGNRQLGTPGK